MNNVFYHMMLEHFKVNWMGLSRIMLKLLVAFCLFGASVGSAVNESDAVTYSAYDTPSFSVEYPSDWEVERSLSAEDEGWKYTFTGHDLSQVDLQDLDIADASMKSIYLTIGAEQVELQVMGSLDNFENGRFGAPMQHFLDTLIFKDGDVDTSAVPNTITYTPYDSVYFSVEYPLSWRINKDQVGSLSATMYLFADRSFTSIAGVTFGTMESLGQTLDFASVLIEVPRESVGGDGFGEPIQHFIDTLHFKM